MLAPPNHKIQSLSPARSTGSDDDQSRSYFDLMTGACGVVRILLVGQAGSGKSTLISEIFDFELDRATVQDFMIGEHDINHEITATGNNIITLHDSKGIESGSAENLKTITDFIRDRKDRPFCGQLHVIWHCIEIPIAGRLPFEAPDRSLLSSLLKMENKVPVIIVFTKLDRLQYREQKRLKKVYTDRGMDPKSAQTKAKTDSVAAAQKEYETCCVTPLKSSIGPAAWACFCPVSNKQFESIATLIQLTGSTLLSECSKFLWASLPNAGVDLKVEMSLKAGKNICLPGRGAALIPLKGIHRITLLTIISRIHSDVMRIWNFNDPQKILVGANMKAMIRKLLVEPIIARGVEGTPGSDGQAEMNPGMIAHTIADTAKILEKVAVSTPETARILMAFLADLTLGTEGLYWLAATRKSKAVTRQDLVHAFMTYRASSRRRQVHTLIQDYIRDKKIMLSFSTDDALKRVAYVVSQTRFDPQQELQDLQ